MNSYKSVRNMNNENGTDTGNTLMLTYKLQINTQLSISLIQKKVLFFFPITFLRAQGWEKLVCRRKEFSYAFGVGVLF